MAKIPTAAAILCGALIPVAVIAAVQDKRFKQLTVEELTPAQHEVVARQD